MKRFIPKIAHEISIEFPIPLSCLLPNQFSIEKYSKIIYKLQQLRPSTHGNIHWRTAMTHIESPHRSQQIPEKCRRKNHIHNESITKVVKSKVVKSLHKFVPLKNQKEKQEKSQKWFQSKEAEKKTQAKILSISFEIYCQNA